MLDLREIGINVLTSRMQLGLSKKELAEKASVSIQSIDDIELFKQLPSIQEFSAIAKALDTTSSVLLSEVPIDESFESKYIAQIQSLKNKTAYEIFKLTRASLLDLERERSKKF